jgi:hypothetical protein
VAAPEDSELEGNAISTTDTVVKECSQQKSSAKDLVSFLASSGLLIEQPVRPDRITGLGAGRALPAPNAR